MVRDRDRIESEERKKYIQAQLQTETKVDLRQALGSALASELAREISLQTNTPYAATVVEMPRLSSRRTEPNLLRMIGYPTALMAAIGFTAIVLIAVFRRERR